MEIKKINSADNLAESLVFLSLITVVLPFVIIIIDKIIPCCSIVIEEAVKALAVFFIILRIKNTGQKFIAAVTFGFLWGLSENILYLVNVINFNNLNIFWQRCALIIPMHIITTVIILISSIKNKKLIFIGFILAILFHYFFNLIQLKPYLTFFGF